MANYVKVRGEGGAVTTVKIGGNGLSEGAFDQAIRAGKWVPVKEDAPALPAAEPENTPEPITEDSAAEPAEAPAPKRKPGRPRKTTTKTTESK